MKCRITLAALTALTMMLTGSLSVHADDSYGKFVWGEDNWRFPNRSEYFENGYYLTNTDKAALRSSLSNTEWRLASEYLAMDWSGSCYGMAVTSFLACYDLIDYGEYRCWDLVNKKGPAASVYDMTMEDGTLYAQPTSEMQSLINYYWLLQVKNDLQFTAGQRYNSTEAERLQNVLDCLADDSPVLLSIFGRFYGGESSSAHAVLAHGVEYGIFELNGRTYDGRIHVYDSNVITSQKPEEQYIYFDSVKLTWEYPHYELFSETGALLCGTDDIGMINDGGLIGGTEYTSDAPYLAVMTVFPQNMTEHSVRKINFNDGSWTVQAEESTDIQEYAVCADYVLGDTESGYVLETADMQELDLDLSYEHVMFFSDAASASQAVFHPSGYAEISGDNTEYTLEMVFNEGHYQGSWYDFSVSGTADSASLQKTEEGWIITSDNLQNVTAKAGNDEIEATLTFSADADSVLLYEADKSTLAAKIDTDGDGTYETKLSTESETSIYGDFNSDGLVNAVDAALILQYAAYAGSGGTYSFIDYIASFT